MPAANCKLKSPQVAVLVTAAVILLYGVAIFFAVPVDLYLVSVLLPLVLGYFWGSTGGVAGGFLGWGGLFGSLMARTGLSLQPEQLGTLLFGLLFFPGCGYVFGKIQAREREWSRLIRRLQASYAAIKTLHEATGLEEALNRFTEIVCRDLGFGNAAVLLRNPDDSLVVAAHYGFDLAPRGVTLALGEGISSRALSQGRPVVVGDVSRVPDYVPGLPGARSQVSLPLESGKEIVGVLTVESTRPNAFSPDDIAILEAVAEQASVAIEKARLLEETQKLLRESLRLAMRDGLTELYNHRYFKQRLREEVARAQRAGTAVALVLLDIDDFKNINDTYGHPVGDKVLTEFARLLEGMAREGDTVARYGGEEFAVILAGTGKEGARAFCHRLARTVAEHTIVVKGKIAVKLTVSIGAAVYPTDADKWDSLINAADSALYRAKREGKNKIRFAAG